MLLFVHFVSMSLIFGGVVIEAIALLCAPYARDIAGLRSTLFAVPAVKPIMGLGAVLTFGTGIWMATAYHLWAPWNIVALVALTLVGINGFVVLEPRLERLRMLVSNVPADRPVPSALRAMANDGLLHVAGWANKMSFISILILMRFKTGWTWSILWVVLFTAVGLLAGFLALAIASNVQLSRANNSRPAKAAA